MVIPKEVVMTRMSCQKFGEAVALSCDFRGGCQYSLGMCLLLRSGRGVLCVFDKQLWCVWCVWMLLRVVFVPMEAHVSFW